MKGMDGFTLTQAYELVRHLPARELSYAESNASNATPPDLEPTADDEREELLPRLLLVG